jgi:hypothetical protein
MEIREVPLGGNHRDFLDVVNVIYKNDPAYIRPLDLEVRDRLNPKKNPFFEHGEGTSFVAYKTGRCVGRVTAQIDRGHLERHNDSTGFFGFFDTIDDQEIANALLLRAAEWLKARGVKNIRGPLSLSLNEESGCLVDGFDSPPFVSMPHHLPYQAKLIENSGFKKAKDLFAWRYEVGDMNTRVRRAAEEIHALPEISVREFSVKHIERDTKICVDIFNDGWHDNWGFVPLTEKEAQKLAADFKLVLMPEITQIVSIDGEPAAFAIALPNINEFLPGLNGKAFPLGLAKVLYGLKVRGAKSGRLALLGIRRKLRGVRKYAGLSMSMYAAMNDGGRRIGMTWGELSWTLEDNGPVNVAIKALGAKKYKTYRIYEKALL